MGWKLKGFRGLICAISSMAPTQHKTSDGLGAGEVTATTDVVGATKLRLAKK